MTKVVWAMCVWSLGCAVTTSAGARSSHASFITTQSSPFDGVLRFLAPEPSSHHHKTEHVVRVGKPARLTGIRVALARTHRAQRTPVVAQAAVRGPRVVHVAIAPPYLRSPYPPRFVPRYPGQVFASAGAYAGPPAFAGYDPRYPPSPYVYRYGYPYPYYVYYAVPWPGWPAGY